MVVDRIRGSRWLHEGEQDSVDVIGDLIYGRAIREVGGEEVGLGISLAFWPPEGVTWMGLWSSCIEPLQQRGLQR